MDDRQNTFAFDLHHGFSSAMGGGGGVLGLHDLL